MDKIKLLLQLTAQEESNFLDFKQQWPSSGNKIDLVHDILCMANSDSEREDRFLVFGVSDRDHKIVGVQDRPYTKDQLYDLLRDKMAPVPTLSLITVEYEGKEVDILKITPKERDLPYVLNRDLESRGKRLKQNVVFVRNGSTNTPKDSCANVLALQELFRRREGRNLRTFDQFRHYIKDKKNWDVSDDEDPLGNPIFCKFDTQLTIRREKDILVWKLADIEQVPSYAHFVSCTALNKVFWNCKKDPRDCRLEDSISVFPVGVYWGEVPIFKKKIIRIAVKDKPFPEFNGFYLPDLSWNKDISNKQKILKLPEYHICRLFSYLTKGSSNNDLILDYINWEYIKDPSLYRLTHQKEIYKKRPSYLPVSNNPLKK